MIFMISPVHLNDVRYQVSLDGTAFSTCAGLALHLGDDDKHSGVSIRLGNGKSFMFDGVGRDALIAHFESIIDGQPSDALQSVLFESYSNYLLETKGDDPLYATSEEYPLSGIATAVENAFFSSVGMLNYVRPGVGDELAELVNDAHLQLVNVRGYRDTFPIYQRGYPVDSYLSVDHGSVKLYKRARGGDTVIADLSNHYDDITGGYLASVREPLETLWGRTVTEEVYHSLESGLRLYLAFPIGTRCLWEEEANL